MLNWPADLRGAVEQVHLVAALGEHRRRGEARGPGADHGDALLRRRRCVVQLDLVAGARIDQARGDLVLEGVVEAGLVAGDAGVDAVGASGRGLDHEVGVGQQRPRHRHHVGASVGDDLLGDFRGVDAIGRA
jgi:hypothetical protein